MRAVVKRQRGFSLVEVVVAIVVMSIISIGLLEFIANSASGYSDTAMRNQMSSAGRIVIHRIAMDLRNALPESVRISPVLTMADQAAGKGSAGDQCLEFIPVLGGTTYIDLAVRPAAYKTTFDVVDFIPSRVGRTGVYAVVYPTAPEQIYGANLNGPDVTEAIARVNITDGALANTDTVTTSRLSDNAAYGHRFRRHSSVDRLFLTEQPISYCISGSKLYRYSNYGFASTPKVPLEPDGDCTAGINQCLPSATPGRVLITDQVDNGSLVGAGAGQAFDEQFPSRQRNAVVQLELNFGQDGEEVRLNHEVLLQITP